MFFYAGDRVIELRHAYDDAFPHKRIEQPRIATIFSKEFASTTDGPSSDHIINDDPKLAIQQAAASYTYDTRKEFVWGLDYIDELAGVISHSNQTDVLEYILQDASYNVVASVVDNAGSVFLTYQFRYDPYGGWSTLELGTTGADLSLSAERFVRGVGWWRGVSKSGRLLAQSLSGWEFARRLCSVTWPRAPTLRGSKTCTLL